MADQQKLPALVQALRPEVLDFEPYAAGLSIEEIRERYGLECVIKLASNENPLGVPPLVQKRLKASVGFAFRYPKPDTPRLCKAIAHRMGVDPSRVVVGNGSDEIIDILIRVRAVPGRDNVLAFKPCFSMYKLQSKFLGVEFRQVPVEADFTYDLDKLAAAVDEHTALVFVTSPDNPSGYAPKASLLEKFARSLPETCILVVDEAYMDFAVPEEEYSIRNLLGELDNLVILRTFSKVYGLAGLRLGYGMMHPALADYLWRVRLPFSVNLMAEEAGIAAIEDTCFYEATLKAVHTGREWLAAQLSALGCTPKPTQANFILFALPEGCPLSAKDVFEKLLERGIIIRPLGSYGLPDSLRVSIGAERENQAFIDNLKEVLA
ncbi:histidinol-phosphate transaminase [Oceanidesulfovibrio marinus]|uniref:Histidinol-phosphate aminotransferase n=1 Tax=Oceanidesulfovibrio marinus TaxID=370038 RepID=A0ABX6NED2_9BACT|nr:histidinol-phosphate transaminase [Oceanidesulfovibrio marinus]QJT08661.1 histidinol-phosphate transaminase [Oceanidesulfovibrio marinus]